METIAHLFDFLRPRAIDPAQAAEEETRQTEIIDKLAQGIVARRLQSPAVLFLELNRPLGFLYGQAALFFRPFLALFLSPSEIEASAGVLSDPVAFERLLHRIDELSEHTSPKEPASRG